MASNERMGNEALTKLKTFLSRRALLRGSAGGRPVSASPRLAARRGAVAPARRRMRSAAARRSRITYGFWDAAQRPAVEQQIAAFKELHPNITVEPQVVPWADYWTKLQTGVAGGSTYDVFWMNARQPPRLCLAGCARADPAARRRWQHRRRRLPGIAAPHLHLRRDGLRHPARLRHHRPLLQQGPLRRSRSGVPDWRLDLGRPARRRREADDQGGRYRVAMGLWLDHQRSSRTTST